MSDLNGLEIEDNEFSPISAITSSVEILASFIEDFDLFVEMDDVAFASVITRLEDFIGNPPSGWEELCTAWWVKSLGDKSYNNYSKSEDIVLFLTNVINPHKVLLILKNLRDTGELDLTL